MTRLGLLWAMCLIGLAFVTLAPTAAAHDMHCTNGSDVWLHGCVHNAVHVVEDVLDHIQFEWVGLP